MTTWFPSGEWTAVSQHGLAVLGHFLWQGSVVAILAAGALSILRRASATARYRVLVAALCAMTACPLLTTVWLDCTPTAPAPRAATLIPAAVGAASTGQGDTGRSPEPAVPLARLEKPDVGAKPPAGAPAEPPTPTPLADGDLAARWRAWAPWLAWAYLAGVGFGLVRLVLGLHGGRRLCREARRVEQAELVRRLAELARGLHLRTAPTLAICGRVAVPTVVGIVRPTILLPLTIASGLPPHELELVLIHELAHLRRYDHWINLIQRLVESFLFFHPAVWWLSRRIRIERENCCDDIVVSLGARSIDYASSLLHVAELSCRSPADAALVAGLSAIGAPSELRTRIERLLGSRPTSSIRLTRSWPLWCAVAVAGVLVVPVLAPPRSTTDSRGGTFSLGGTVSAVADEPAQDDLWGPVADGLRARIRLVDSTTDEQRPDWQKSRGRTSVDRAADLTVLVEIRNVGEQAVKLQGTRYGHDVTPPWPGKSVSSEFAPFLFDYELLDRDGKPIAVAQRRMVDTDVMLTLSGGMAESLEPGQSLIMLVRPLAWNPSPWHQLTKGQYQLRLRYHGPRPAVVAEFKKHWPDKPLASAWTGLVATNVVDFTLDRSPAEHPELVWGPVINGLQAAVQLVNATKTDQAERDNATLIFPLNTQLQVRPWIKNVSDHEISFWSDAWRQDDTVYLIDKDNKETGLPHAWYSGWPRREQWTLQPGQTAVLNAIGLGLAADDKAAQQFVHPIGATITGAAGTYRIRYEMRIQPPQQGKPDGRSSLRTGDPQNWQGTLSTGIVSLKLRPRTPADDEPRVPVTIELHSPTGQELAGGEVEVSVQSTRKKLWAGPIAAGRVVVPDCPREPLTAYVRAPGFEETRFWDIQPLSDTATQLTVPVAEIVKLRFRTRDGRPVANARVRYFNRSKADAAAGPYPPYALQGPVWATANAAGEAILDTLQKVDPSDTKLGNNVYWFYVEAPGLAPRFVGPLQAGDQVPDLQLGPLLEARGEIRGTADELQAFSAEWDQPEPMLRGNGQAGWDYAESKPLEVRRDGERLTFALSDLRPGKLRIVARFKAGGKPVSHVNARREPNEDDVVFEVDLVDSRVDLVVTPQSKPAKPGR